jgi:hypothetical protein
MMLAQVVFDSFSMVQSKLAAFAKMLPLFNHRRTDLTVEHEIVIQQRGIVLRQMEFTSRTHRFGTEPEDGIISSRRCLMVGKILTGCVVNGSL